MSQEKVETVRRAYERVNATLELSRELYDPDVEFDVGDVSVEFGVIRGLEPAQEALREYWQTFENFHVEVIEVLHADEDRVVTFVEDGGRMKGSGAEVWNRLFHVTTFRDGKIVRFSSHTDRNRALEAAGLSEEAMSEENVEIVRRAYEAWNQGGAESAKRFWAEDYEFHDPPDFPDPRVVRGRDAVAAHLQDQTSVLGDLKVTIVDVRARDETVVVRLGGTAHGAESGVEVPAEAAQVFEVAAGRLRRAWMFLTWREALEAAGLRE